MSRIYINPTLEKSIREYCEINSIDDINAFANRCAMQGLNIIKFGTSPVDNINRENNGINDIKKNERTKKENPIRKDKGEQVKAKEESGREEPKEIIEPDKEGKVTVRKIKVIKK